LMTSFGVLLIAGGVGALALSRRGEGTPENAGRLVPGPRPARHAAEMETAVEAGIVRRRPRPAPVGRHSR
jgi:hypothetical protein